MHAFVQGASQNRAYCAVSLINYVIILMFPCAGKCHFFVHVHQLIEITEHKNRQFTIYVQ